jgi:hypothetical protein
MRTLATCDTAKLLGFDVICRTEIGIGTPPPPPRNQEPQLGLVMSHAKGQPGGEHDREMFNNPDVRRELTKLQLLDHLTGQGDRHHKNYFIHQDQEGKVTVTGIDNDLCFGKWPADPNGIAFKRTEDGIGFNGTAMPPVMDREMVRVFEELTPEALEATLEGKLGDREIAAALARLEGIKKHIQTLRDNGRIIEVEDWGEQWVTDLLSWENSYIGREQGLGRVPSQVEIARGRAIREQFVRNRDNR